MFIRIVKFAPALLRSSDTPLPPLSLPVENQKPHILFEGKEGVLAWACHRVGEARFAPVISGTWGKKWTKRNIRRAIRRSFWHAWNPVVLRVGLSGDRASSVHGSLYLRVDLKNTYKRSKKTSNAIQNLQARNSATTAIFRHEKWKCMNIERYILNPSQSRICAELRQNGKMWAMRESVWISASFCDPKFRMRQAQWLSLKFEWHLQVHWRDGDVLQVCSNLYKKKRLKFFALWLFPSHFFLTNSRLSTIKFLYAACQLDTGCQPLR